MLWHLDLWVPPVTWWDKIKGKVTSRVSSIVSQARDRVSFQMKTSYNPPKNKAEQREIRNCFYDALARDQISIDSFPWPGPVGMVVIGYGPKDKWWPGRPFTRTPDVTNMAKQVEDALAPDKKGTEYPFPGAYKNDQQVVFSVSFKQYGDTPGTMVRLLFLDGEMVEPKKKSTGPKKRAQRKGPSLYTGAMMPLGEVPLPQVIALDDPILDV